MSQGRYRPYPEYKDSGDDWVGAIPASWSVIPVKRLCSIYNGATPKSGIDSFWDGRIPWVTPADLGKETTPYIATGARSISELGFQSCATSLVPKNSVILSSRAPIGTLGIASSELCTNQGCKSLVVASNSDFKFVYYYLLISNVRLNVLGRGSTFLEISSEELGNYKITAPSLPEQTQIAKFLDHETAKIDRLIEKQEALIRLLKEKRQAVISHAVTKGLNPHAPLKDSGIAWLGQVPAHWEIKKAKFLTESVKAGPFGSALTKDVYVTAGYRVYGQEQVIPNDFTVGDYHITAAKYAELIQYRVAPGDILISCVGTFGKIAIVPHNIAPGIINPRLIRLRCSKEILSRYLLEVMRSQVTFEQFSSFSRGGTMDVINIGTLNEIYVALSPSEEQLALLNFILREMEKFDALTAETQLAIELMQERRTALISAAVTGKIDVRHWQPPAEQGT